MKKIETENIYESIARRAGYELEGEPSENPTHQAEFICPSIPGGKYEINFWAESNEFCADLTLYLSQYEGRSSSGIARVLAPIPIGLVEDEDAGALFTWGTENKGLYSQADVEQYFAMFNTLIFQYAQENHLDLAKLARDPIMRDVFNRAVINTAVRNYQSLNARPSVVDVDVLDERAKDGELAKVLRGFRGVYLDASGRVSQLNPGNQVFLHGDARPENIGQDKYGIRPLVDWANAKTGIFAEDFSALETESSEQYLGWYKFVSGFRGADFVDEDARELVTCFDVLQPYRTASFKIGKGKTQEVQRDLQRLEANIRQYKDVFKL